MAKEETSPKPIYYEILGLCLGAVGILILLALISHHPTDPSFSSHQVGDLPITNWVGKIGSYLSAFLFEFLGLASFWLSFIFFQLAFYSFRKEPISSPYWQATGYLLVIFSFAALLSRGEQNFQYFGWNFPWGGILGYLIFHHISLLLNPPGTHIFLIVVLLTGFILITRVSLARLGERVQARLLDQLSRWRDAYQKNRERKRKAKSLRVEKEIQKEKEAHPPTIVQSPVFKPVAPLPRPQPQQEQFVFMKEKGEFELPPLTLLDTYEKNDQEVQQQSLLMNSRLLEKKLKDFGVEGQVTEVSPGPVITMYEFEPAPGVKISRVTGLADDLSMAMRAVSIRIVAPLPGKPVIGIEIPNSQRETVGLKDILSSQEFSESQIQVDLSLGQRYFGFSRSHQSGQDASPVDCRGHRHRQERVSERLNQQYSF